MDVETGLLWVANRHELLYFELKQERWKRAERHLWAKTDRVVNIGTSGSQIFVETIPESAFDRFVTNARPLPNPRWLEYVTRYVGTRSYGGFRVDVSDTEPANARWRGLRSRLPLDNSQLGPTTLGRPPAGFPPVLPPDGWIWNMDGTLVDSDLRPHAITDWYIDGYNRFWSTHWGAGILTVNLYNVRGDLFMQGPAGNDIGALLVTDEELWMGGINDGEYLGFSRADHSLKSWSFVERRDNTRIRSTVLADLAIWDNRIWFATEDGLLAYDNKGRWRIFVVQDNLFDNNVQALRAAGDELWIGTAGGLNVMVKDGQFINRVPQGGLKTFGVTDIEVAGDTIYVGSPVGLFSAPQRTREFRFTDLDPGMLADEVKDISVIGDEYWLVTAQGVMRHDQSTGESKSWEANIWLDKAEPSCVHAMEKFVWIGTEHDGFFRYTRRSGEWIQYTVADGLVSNRVKIIRDDGDDLLIGTASGLTRFYWNRPHKNR
jgi:hypothetical protein